ncbi:hypothetical protein NC651_020769 [Populus alba x Populus x berolinensis]|nr:hypothetical protein NC651_020769 [Populus alba x Populus x berolinensis]
MSIFQVVEALDVSVSVDVVVVDVDVVVEDEGEEGEGEEHFEETRNLELKLKGLWRERKGCCIFEGERITGTLWDGCESEERMRETETGIAAAIDRHTEER